MCKLSMVQYRQSSPWQQPHDARCCAEIGQMWRFEVCEIKLVVYRKSEMLSECTAVQQYHLGVSLYNLIKENSGLEITYIHSFRQYMIF